MAVLPSELGVRIQSLLTNSSSKPWSDETSPVLIKYCLRTHTLTAEAVKEN